MSAEPVTARLSGLRHQAALWNDRQTDVEIAITGPLGCGKTLALAVKQLLLRADNKGISGMLVVPTFPVFQAVHSIEWPEIWRQYGVGVEWHHERHGWLWPESFGRSMTYVRTAEIPRRLAGPNLSDVTFDEPGQMDREAYDRGSLRARHPRACYRQVILGGTPEGINWFADLFDDPSPPRKRIRALEWHPTMSHYKQKILERYGYDASLLAAYGRGEFVPLRVGRCYTAFNAAVHVRELAIEKHCEIVLACDFNVDTMRWEICQIVPGAREFRVVDEIALGAGGTTASAANEFVRRVAPIYGKGREITITGDAAGKARSTSGEVDYNVLREVLTAGGYSVRMRVPEANPRQKDRVDAVNYHLAGRGLAVFVSPRCKELIADFQRCAWREGTSELDKRDPLRTHASDALGYAVWELARPNFRGASADLARPQIPLHDQVQEARI